MIKARNKKFSLLMAIIFLFTIMVPLVGPAAAGTTYTVHSAKSWDSDQKGAIFNFSVKIDPCSEGNHAAIVKFPSDVLIQDVTASSVTDSVYGLEFDFDVNDNEFLMKFANNELKKVEFIVTVEGDLDNYTGIISADVDRLYGDFVTASVNGLGRAGDGDITVSTGKVAVITEAGGEINPIYFKENTSNAVAGEKKALKIKLPKGFEWTDVAVEDVTTGTKNLPFYTEDNERSIVVKGNEGVLNDVPGYPNYVKITGSLKVIDKKANYGDIEAELSSDVSLDPTSLVIAKYADYVATIEAAEDDVVVLAGRIDQEISDIIIKEEAPGSLIENRSISLTLPNNAKWYFGEDEDGDIIDKGDVDVNIKTDKGSKITFKDTYLVDSRTLKLVINKGTENGDAATLRLKDLAVMLAGDVTGDLEVEVTGNAGVKGEVVVAEVVAPITATSDIKDIRIGLQAQTAGDITITEIQGEAIMDRNDLYEPTTRDTELLVRLPVGIDWANTPKVTVTEGDLELGEVKVDLEDNWLVIPIEDSSDKASTIKITDIQLTSSRSLPEGIVEVKIGGSAVNETYDDIFKAWTVASTENANIITPAPGETKQTAVFTLGSSTYTVNGIEQTMDTAAFAQDGRTYLPVRYAGYALGVDEDSIYWDDAAKTATLIKGDKVVQLTIGDKAMTINGAKIGLDVAPIVKDGRTFLPFRWIANAFGASVDYDDATKTVTMNLDSVQ